MWGKKKKRKKKKGSLTKSHPGSRYRIFTLRHSLIILRTFRRHSSTARSYPAALGSLALSGLAGGATGSKGRTARGVVGLRACSFFQMRLMACCGGGFFFFRFFSSFLELLGGRGRGRLGSSDSSEEL